MLAGGLCGLTGAGARRGRGAGAARRGGLAPLCIPPLAHTSPGALCARACSSENTCSPPQTCPHSPRALAARLARPFPYCRLSEHSRCSTAAQTPCDYLATCQAALAGDEVRLGLTPSCSILRLTLQAGCRSPQVERVAPSIQRTHPLLSVQVSLPHHARRVTTLTRRALRSPHLSPSQPPRRSACP